MANPSVLQEQLEILAGTRRQGNQGKAAVRYEDFNKQIGTLQADIDGLSGTKSNVTRTINAYTGTTHTLSLVDAGNVVWMTNVGAKTLIVPPNASVAFPTGTQIDNFCSGGKLTFAPGSGVTIFSYNSKFGLESFRFATLLKIDTDAWALDGALVT
jgi:hypothetical protein